MAIDPRIALAGTPLNIGQRFGQNIQNLQQIDLLNQRRQQAPIQQQLLEMQSQLAQAQQPGLIQQAELAASPTAQAISAQQQATQFDVSSAQGLKPFLDADDRLGAIAQLTRQRQNAIDFNLPQAEIDEINQAIQVANQPEGIQRLKQVTDSFLQSSGVLPRQQVSVSQIERDKLIEQAKGDHESIETMAAKVALGIAPRASISAQERIAEDPSLAGKVAKSQSNITGSKEEARLNAQLKLEPEIATAVDTAKRAVKDAADQAAKERTNQGALNVYEVGIRNLAGALGRTTTGPIASVFTSLTDSARTAEGARAIMLPILKQMFRTAGEGTFTDKDQELLEAMLPTRQDRTASIKSKLTMLDAAVRAKLGVQLVTGGTDILDTTDLSKLSLEELIELRGRGGQ